MGFDENNEGNSLPANLPSQNGAKLPQLFQDLGLGKVSTNDKFTIKYSDGSLKVSVKRSDGVTQTVNRHVSSGFRAMTEFNPTDMASKDDRNDEIRRRYKNRETQQELAELFGLSQAMISNIVSGQ